MVTGVSSACRTRSTIYSTTEYFYSIVEYSVDTRILSAKINHMEFSFQREIVGRLHSLAEEHERFLHVVVGPRQVGKTTAALQLEQQWAGQVHYAAADESPPPGPEWIRTHWDLARQLPGSPPAMLILDEVQKVAGWSEVVKACFDEDRRAARALRVLLLGSSALLVTQGLTESLAGRFVLHRPTHWSFPECAEAFGWDLDKWLYYGGYPGAERLVSSLDLWRSYVLDSLIETVLARDVLALRAVAKPALLRHLFGLATRFPAQILSYNKMLGQLTDAGNTTTLAGYLKLFAATFLVSGLERYSAGSARKRGSSPKLVLWNNGLVTAPSLMTPAQWRDDPARWGRLVENAVGAHLLNGLQGLPYEITYWRERHDEVDFVVRGGSVVWALEVKSGRPGRLRGLAAFSRRYPESRPLIIGAGGLPLREFFAANPAELFVG